MAAAADESMIRKLDKRLAGLQSARTNWDSTYQEVAEYVFPDRADFTVSWPPGAQRNRALLDSTAVDSMALLVAALQSLLTNPTGKWLRMVPMDAEVQENQSAMEYADMAPRAILDTLYADGVNYVPQEHEMYQELCAFGTACLMSEEDERTTVRVRAYPIRDVFYAENSKGLADTVFRRQMMTARQISQDWPKSDSITVLKQALEDNPEQEFEVVHCVLPRADAPRNIPAKQRTQRDMPFASIWYLRNGMHLLAESGYHEQPYHIVRWTKRSGETMGVGPGLAALPSCRMLNAMKYTAALSAEKVANPPILVPDDGLLGPVNMGPGGLTYYRAGAGGAADSIKAMPTPSELSPTLELVREERETVRRIFLNPQLQPSGGPQMTATQALIEQEEKMRALGPALGRMQSEYLGTFINRVFNILLRAGKIPPAPEALQGREVRFEYDSPIARAQRLTAAKAFSQAMEYMAPVIQMDMQVLDNFDRDKVVRDTQQVFGYPADYLVDEKDVQATRDQRAEQQAQMAQAQNLQQGVSTAAEAAKAGLIGNERQ